MREAGRPEGAGRGDARGGRPAATAPSGRPTRDAVEKVARGAEAASTRALAAAAREDAAVSLCSARRNIIRAERVPRRRQ